IFLTSSRSSNQRCHESVASPLDSTVPVLGVCSHFHQSLLVLPPSIWCAAVAVPHSQPAGTGPKLLMGVKVPSASGGVVSVMARSFAVTKWSERQVYAPRNRRDASIPPKFVKPVVVD